MLLIANVSMPSFTPTLRGAVEAVIVQTNLSESVGQNLDKPLKVMSWCLYLVCKALFTSFRKVFLMVIFFIDPLFQPWIKKQIDPTHLPGLINFLILTTINTEVKFDTIS